MRVVFKFSQERKITNPYRVMENPTSPFTWTLLPGTCHAYDFHAYILSSSQDPPKATREHESATPATY